MNRKILFLLLIFVICIVVTGCSMQPRYIETSGKVVGSDIKESSLGIHSDFTVRYYLLCKSDDYNNIFRVLVTSEELSMYKEGDSVEFSIELIGDTIKTCQLLRR